MNNQQPTQLFKGGHPRCPQHNWGYTQGTTTTATLPRAAVTLRHSTGHFYDITNQVLLHQHSELLQVPTKRARREHVPYYLLRLTAPDGHYQLLQRGQSTGEHARDDMTPLIIGTTTTRLHCDGDTLLPVELPATLHLQLCDDHHENGNLST